VYFADARQNLYEITPEAMAEAAADTAAADD
jgi:hypothetical protein